MFSFALKKKLLLFKLVYPPQQFLLIPQWNAYCIEKFYILKYGGYYKFYCINLKKLMCQLLNILLKGNSWIFLLSCWCDTYHIYYQQVSKHLFVVKLEALLMFFCLELCTNLNTIVYQQKLKNTFLLQFGWSQATIVAKNSNLLKQNQSISHSHCHPACGSCFFSPLSNFNSSIWCLSLMAHLSNLRGMVCLLLDTWSIP